MNLYDTYILPYLINLAMQNKAAKVERARFVSLASGRVLEIGIGSGLNIPFYPADIEALYGIDPSRELLRMGRKRAAGAAFPVKLMKVSGERLPLQDESFDTVVTTWTLCTIPDPVQALMEVRRVLKPEGRVIFIEHGGSPDAGVLQWQNRLNPVWSRLAGGCNLNRKIDALIRTVGFEITQLETGYASGPKPFTYLYRGVARRLDAAGGPTPQS
jgi:ubiquinone/menaquinone biosynthesis C-methylase UbiE